MTHHTETPEGNAKLKVDPRCTCGAVDDGKWANVHSFECPAAFTIDTTLAKLHFCADRQRQVTLNKHEVLLLITAMDSAFENGRTDAIAEMHDNERQYQKDLAQS